MIAKGSKFSTVFEFGEVFCFTDILSGFLFKVRVKVEVGGGFKVRVRVRASFRDSGLHITQHCPS